MWRVVDIAEDGRFIGLSHGSLTVSLDGRCLGKVPLSDIQSVIVHGHGSTISLSLASALAEAGIPLVLCSRSHAPAALCLPVSGNYENAARIAAQAGLSLPKRKRLWRGLVQQKIGAQARCLEIAGHPGHLSLRRLTPLVRSGDPENIEARAARYYWPRLMGQDFRRDRNGGGLNAPLNYGYTVVRAAVARAIVAAGLAPGLGLHHRSRLNAFQLADDLMEPFRPIVDRLVWENRAVWTEDLSQDARRSLADIANLPMATESGSRSVSAVMSALALSLAEVCLGSAEKLDWPNDWAIAAQGDLGLGNEA